MKERASVVRRARTHESSHKGGSTKKSGVRNPRNVSRAWGLESLEELLNKNDNDSTTANAVGMPAITPAESRQSARLLYDASSNDQAIPWIAPKSMPTGRTMQSAIATCLIDGAPE